MKNIILQKKIDTAPEEIQELFTLLVVDDELFEEVFLKPIENTNTLIENKIDFVSLAFCVAYNLNTPKDIESFLSKIGYRPEDTFIIMRNLSTNFLSSFKELINESTKPEENIQASESEIKNTDSNHISHVDVLSEIENPTPSISTTTSFQSQITPERQTISESPKQPLKDSATQPSSPNTSLHSSASIALYINPALKIASKLDQKLDGPSASLPKDVYVSKKPDPYHEPVDL